MCDLYNLAKRYGLPVDFQLMFEGPCHNMIFTVRATVRDFTTEAKGPSKKAAKTLASAMVLDLPQRLFTPAAKKTCKEEEDHNRCWSPLPS